MNEQQTAGRERSSWVLVLGASSGFGAASALAFAEAGYDVAGVHLDRRAGLQEVARLRERIEQMGRQAVFFNVNAADEKKREGVLDSLQERFAPQGDKQPVKVLLHSLAFGTLRPFWKDGEGVSRAQMDMTLDVMAHSLVYWTQGLMRRDLMGEGGRIFAMTSAGSHRVWQGYGPVSAAKAALEAHCRQLAVELAPHGITVNAVCAGVTDTPALRKIPGHERMVEDARRRNPHGRLTTPRDVAECLVALSAPGTAWMTGNVLFVDGGEDIAG